ncbi:hypothetical protein [Cognatiyoonia sp. IB215182]|uniref:hypothetical protein n=1 Tax=Cognatiyoonia sp. IB215182 TaxID=3097353 RepID=UPI002A0B8169|nr:hypothetical protein [Cognatiyoonia sp. IB215182]MDX8355566.1 hypothetical protein [Cognatiyoonia sp. IB215182]
MQGVLVVSQEIRGRVVTAVVVELSNCRTAVVTALTDNLVSPVGRVVRALPERQVNQATSSLVDFQMMILRRFFKMNE